MRKGTRAYFAILYTAGTFTSRVAHVDITQAPSVLRDASYFAPVMKQ